jgi:hypothetical protein
MLQKQVCPVVEHHLLAFANDVQRVVVSGLQAFAELSLRLLPVFGLR